MFVEIIWLRDGSSPPFCIAISHWFLEQNKQDEDEETLEGHKDGEDESKSKKPLNFYHQNSNDPSNAHHHSQRDGGLQPAPIIYKIYKRRGKILNTLVAISSNLPNLFSFFFMMLSVLLFVSDNNGHYKEANVGQ